jgi:hypothetical protein
MRTYSLQEAAEIICGADEPSKAKWLAKRLRTGQLAGYKCGRHWRMTEADITNAIELLRPKTVAMPDVSVMRGLTRTSARRLSA